jgi:hypothetical protein
MSHRSMWTVSTIASLWGGDKARFTSWAEMVMGMWEHLVWVMGPLMAT